MPADSAADATTAATEEGVAPDGGSHRPHPATLEEIAAGVASAATELVRSRLGRSQSVYTKATPTDVVTTTDMEVESLIRSELLEATPGATIRGEEQADVAGTTSLAWIVDPIDGTVNFLYDLPVMSVSIAAAIDGHVVAGAVADVVRGEVFSGSKGNGVTRDGAPCSPSRVVRLSEALVATGFSYSADQRRGEGAIVARLLPEARDIRCFGSAALHLCWVACGRLEAFYQHGLKEWDVAAGALLAAEAGTHVELGSESNGGLVLAATPGVFAPLRALILEGGATTTPATML